MAIVVARMRRLPLSGRAGKRDDQGSARRHLCLGRGVCDAPCFLEARLGGLQEPTAVDGILAARAKRRDFRLLEKRLLLGDRAILTADRLDVSLDWLMGRSEQRQIQ